MELETYIKENWDKTARLAREDDNGNIGLPYRYFVPSIEGGFCNLFYWDSFLRHKECSSMERKNSLRALWMTCSI